MTSVDLRGCVAIVTGAGGALGRGHALLASLGAKSSSMMSGRSPSHRAIKGARQSAVTQTLSSRGSAQREAKPSQAATESTHGMGGERVVRDALDAFERVDIVVNNAGVLRDRPFHNLNEDELDAVLKVICTAPSTSRERPGLTFVVNATAGS